MSLVFLVAIGILGLLVGSFLNVVVYRVPNGMSIVSPRSACPRCGALIAAYDNVPVLSWLVLRGQCRTCKTPISVHYPLVELGTGVFFALVGWAVLGSAVSTSSTTWVGLSSGFNAVVGEASIVAVALILVAFLYLAAVSVALASIDLTTHTLPNAIVLPSYIVGAVLLGVAGVIDGNFDALLRAGIGMVSLWLAYFLMALAYPGGMGLGDVKLAGVLGLFLGFLGWGPLATGAFAAFLLGGVFGVALLATKRANRRSGIPFGPWMLAGAWVGVLFGSTVWDGYLTLVGLG